MEKKKINIKINKKRKERKNRKKGKEQDGEK